MDSESAELAIVEKQLKRMEDLVFGTDKNRSDGSQVNKHFKMLFSIIFT